MLSNSLLTLLILVSLSANAQLNDVFNEIRKKFQLDWTISSTTNLEFSDGAFDEGNYITTITFQNKNEKVDFILYEPTGTNSLKDIGNYHMLASCGLTIDGITKCGSILKLKNHYLVLPAYPCWSGYSEKEKSLINLICCG